MKRNDQSVETCRALACILLVAYHVVGSSSTNGLRVADESSARSMMEFLGYIRMPMFTFLSGVVYALRPAQSSRYRQFAAGKARRLLFPLVAVTTLFVIAKAFQSPSDLRVPLSEIWMIYLFPFAHFWFLQAIFVIMMLIMLIDGHGLASSFRHWLLIFCLSLIPFAYQDSITSFFSINKAAYLLPFFLFGLAFTRFRGRICRAQFLPPLIGGVALAGSIALLNEFQFLSIAPYTDGIIALIIGIGVPSILLISDWQSRLIAPLGQFSFAIYLYHVFGIVLARVLLDSVGIQNAALQLTVGVASGLALPVVLQAIWTRTGRWISGAINLAPTFSFERPSK